jgi:hypothetical protein
MASSITVRRPRSSMSRMVKARTPDCRARAASRWIHVAQADDDGVVRVDLGRVAARSVQLRRAGAQNAGQRHAVDVAAGAAGGRVHVGVRVQPDQADIR